MKSTFKWTLLALSIPALIACGGGGGSSDSSDKTPSVKTSSNAIIAARSNAKVGDRVRLDGSHSKGHAGTMLSYAWSITTKPDGSAAELNNVTSVAPYFTPDVTGNYTIELTTTAGELNQSTSYNIHVSDEANNVPPVVMVDVPNKMALGQSITLDSNAYDADGDILTYQWALTSMPDNATLKLTGGANSSAEFQTDTSGEYTLRLTVNDGYETIEKDITFEYTADNVSPVANAGGSQSFELGAQAQLDGSGSFDGNNDALTYNWEFISKPENSNAQLSSTNQAQPNFTPDIIGDYVVALTVSDGEFSSNLDYVRITATDVGSSDLLFVMGDQEPQSIGFIVHQLTVDKTVEGDAPEYILLGEFTVEAKGKDFPIEDFYVVDTKGVTEGKVTGLEKGETVYAGDKVRAKMWAKPTAGQESKMSYSITFNLNEMRYVSIGYVFTSN
tara:strand:- start:1667 stop:3001 length:1335 start_codon:yes stop_codon:yes gene_type:complete